MPGNNGKFKSITVNEKIYDKFELSGPKVNYELNRIVEEKQKMRKFASKIKKYPETVRVYTNPFMEKKSRV